jgi:hypothetical protein
MVDVAFIQTSIWHEVIREIVQDVFDVASEDSASIHSGSGLLKRFQRHRG